MNYLVRRAAAAAPLRRCALALLRSPTPPQGAAAAAAASGALLPRLAPLASSEGRGFHSSAAAWLGFRATGAKLAEFAVDERFYEEEKSGAAAARKGEEDEGLEIAKLGIAKQIVSRLASRGITRLFPIQKAVLEPALQGRDMIGRAKTGTGKTLAFGIPILDAIVQHNEKYKPGRDPLAMVLAPTRELARQVEKEFKESSDLETLCVYGGTPINSQIRKLDYGVDVVIGTPGRVIDLLKRGSLLLSSIQFVVLDEADQMLSVGFDEDVEIILEKMPLKRQTMMFSATMPSWIKKLTQKYLKDPLTIDLVGDDDQKLAEGITLYSIASDSYGRASILGPLIQEHAKDGKCIVFTQTKRDADQLAYAMGRSFACQPLHGDISQAHRERTLAGFRDGRFNILIATDVAARGLDIPNVDLVIHYELPNTSEIFVHRSGRTGRAGKKGSAILIYNYQQTRAVRMIEQDVGCRFKELPKITVEAGASDMLGGGFDSFSGRQGGSGFGRGGFSNSNYGRSRSFGGRGGFGDSSRRGGGFGDSGFSRYGSSGGSSSGRSGGFGSSGFGRSGRSDGFGDSSSGRFGSFGDTNSGRPGGFGDSGSGRFGSSGGFGSGIFNSSGDRNSARSSGFGNSGSDFSGSFGTGKSSQSSNFSGFGHGNFGSEGQQ